MKSGFTVLLLVAIPLLAQPQPRYGETVEVRIIEVEAVVTDKAGNPVHGLTADDFEIFEGRARQPITNFTEYRAPELEESVESSTAPTRAIETPEPRTVLVFIDSLPLRGPKRERVFASIRDFLENGIRPGDRVGIVYWNVFMNYGRTLLEPTPDRAAALRLIDRIAGSPTMIPADTSGAEQAEFIAGIEKAEMDAEELLEENVRIRDEEHHVRMRRKTAALQRLVSRIGAGPGRKVLLYVSGDFGLPPHTSLTRSAVFAMFEAVAREANANRVSIYAIIPEHPDLMPGVELRNEFEGDHWANLGQQVDGLTILTEATGGLLDHGPAAMEKIAPRLASDLDSYYSLGYRARSDGSDRTRNIRVRVANPAYRVRTRRSYVEKSDETHARDQLIARLFAEEGAGELTFTIDRGEPRPERRNRWVLPVTMKIPVGQLRFEEENGRRVARIKVLVAGGNGIAEVSKIREEEIPIVEPPGATGEGIFKYSFELLGDEKGSRVVIGLFDMRTGLAGFEGLDLRATQTSAQAPRARR